LYGSPHKSISLSLIQKALASEEHAPMSSLLFVIVSPSLVIYKASKRPIAVGKFYQAVVKVDRAGAVFWKPNLISKSVSVDPFSKPSYVIIMS